MMALVEHAVQAAGTGAPFEGQRQVVGERMSCCSRLVVRVLMRVLSEVRMNVPSRTTV